MVKSNENILFEKQQRSIVIIVTCFDFYLEWSLKRCNIYNLFHAATNIYMVLYHHMIYNGGNKDVPFAVAILGRNYFEIVFTFEPEYYQNYTYNDYHQLWLLFYYSKI